MRLNLLKYLFFPVILLISNKSDAQDKIFSHYGLEEGISQGAVRTILKDDDGFIWFGTQDGLNRFDGHTFKTYKHDKSRRHSISGNYINSLLEANDKIWIATADNGLCYYDKNTGIFHPIGKIKHNCISISKNDSGNIFALYENNGLHVFTPKKDSFFEHKIYFPQLSNNNIASISQSKNGEILAGTKDGKLYKIKDSTITQLCSINAPFGIKTVSEHNNHIWIGTTNGLYLHDMENRNTTKIYIEIDRENINNPIINDIEQKGDTLYIASDNGLFIASEIDRNNNTFRHIEHLKGDINDKSSITSNRVYNLVLDKNILIIGTNKLDIMYLRKPVFKSYNTKNETALNNDFVFSIFKNDKYTFIGTRNGLNCIDEKGNITAITKENTSGKLAFNVIRGINIDSNNHLWLATTKGISIIDLDDFDPEKPKINSIFSDINNTESLSDNNTRSIFIDNQNRIWVATYGGGICLFTGDIQKKSYSFKTFRHNENQNSISSDFTYHISQDKYGDYWISTKNGLNKLELKPEAFFTVYDKDNSNFATNNILTAIQDTAGNKLWIGSHSGMYSYDLKEKKFSVYSHEQGLTNDVVYSILQDTDNNLWLSTNMGLFNFDITKQVFNNYNTKDGLHSSEFNLGASCKYGDYLYFGGVNGVDYFDPADIKRLYYEGDLIFTSLTVKGKEITPAIDKDILNTNIVKAKAIKLNYNQFPAYIGFSDLYYGLEKSGEFYYRLIPGDKEWNKLKEQREIQFLNLPAGNYTLQVQGKTNGKFWNKNPLQLHIEVVPAWYKSNPAYLLYSAIAALIIFLVYRFQMEKKLNQRELFRLQEIAKKNIIINKALAEKEILFKEIHHRVKNNLQVISSILSLQERYLKNPKAIAAIKDSQNRIEAISLIHQKLYTDQSITAISVKDYIEDLATGIINSMETKNKNINFHSDIEDIMLEVDTVTPVGLILNELITNSIKHNPEKENLDIYIKLFKKDNAIIIMVKDNGKGLKTSHQKTDSYGMKMIESLSKKLKANIHFNNNNGLEVVLTINKYKEAMPENN